MKACAVNLWVCQPHHSDHLAPLCALLQMPLLLSNEAHCQWVQEHYPDLDAQFLDFEHHHPAYFFENYDVMFRANIWDMRVIREQFGPMEEAFGKRLRMVHCPHGMSDKVYWFDLMQHEDIVLIYGDIMREMFKDLGVQAGATDIISMGNQRYAYYQQHHGFMDQKVEEEVFSRFGRRQKTLLYAPTWQDGQNATSFFDAAPALLEKLPEHYNLLVKLHPRIDESDPGALYSIMHQYRDRPNVVFLEAYPYVYPLLARSDIYIGDMSSVGYDFLAFNRPMFFLNTRRRVVDKDPCCYLYRCGSAINPEDYGKFYSILESALESDNERFFGIRREVYKRSFDPCITAKELRSRISDWVRV